MATGNDATPGPAVGSLAKREAKVDAASERSLTRLENRLEADNVPGFGVGLRGDPATDKGEDKKDEALEEYKRMVMSEILRDFNWYCWEKTRSRQDMETWWQQRECLVDALLEAPWPAWGTVGALNRCKSFAPEGVWV